MARAVSMPRRASRVHSSSSDVSAAVGGPPGLEPDPVPAADRDARPSERDARIDASDPAADPFPSQEVAEPPSVVLESKSSCIAASASSFGAPPWPPRGAPDAGDSPKAGPGVAAPAPETAAAPAAVAARGLEVGAAPLQHEAAITPQRLTVGRGPGMGAAGGGPAAAAAALSSPGSRRSGAASQGLPSEDTDERVDTSGSTDVDAEPGDHQAGRRGHASRAGANSAIDETEATSDASHPLSHRGDATSVVSPATLGGRALASDSPAGARRRLQAGLLSSSASPSASGSDMTGAGAALGGARASGVLSRGTTASSGREDATTAAGFAAAAAAAAAAGGSAAARPDGDAPVIAVSSGKAGAVGAGTSRLGGAGSHARDVIVPSTILEGSSRSLNRTLAADSGSSASHHHRRVASDGAASISPRGADPFGPASSSQSGRSTPADVAPHSRGVPRSSPRGAAASPAAASPAAGSARRPGSLATGLSPRSGGSFAANVSPTGGARPTASPSWSPAGTEGRGASRASGWKSEDSLQRADSGANETAPLAQGDHSRASGQDPVAAGGGFGSIAGSPPQLDARPIAGKAGSANALLPGLASGARRGGVGRIAKAGSPTGPGLHHAASSDGASLPSGRQSSAPHLTVRGGAMAGMSSGSIVSSGDTSRIRRAGTRDTSSRRLRVASGASADPAARSASTAGNVSPGLAADAEVAPPAGSPSAKPPVPAIATRSRRDSLPRVASDRTQDPQVAASPPPVALSARRQLASSEK